MAETKYGKYIITDPIRLQGVTRAHHNQASNKWAYGQ